MNAAAVETIAQQIEHLAAEEQWTLLARLIESLRREAGPSRRMLCDYYATGKGLGLRTAQAVDIFIREERASWES